ncbi:hypothetical protein GK091_25405 [Spirosoma agri]|uniref:Uncharacterized protein n=1 Tax=Spirosoma agri TaxID=1987381 RepID=A0A6M0IPD5_9BACT|nr:hypothetical protein [Spirosoma agri]NEU70240.1 hypothetical protein [Spirosoma agri]
MLDWTVADNTIFPTALIATSLLSLASKSRVERILYRTRPFFKNQTMTGGSWHHFAHLHPLRQYFPVNIDDMVYVSNFIR